MTEPTSQITTFRLAPKRLPTSRFVAVVVPETSHGTVFEVAVTPQAKQMAEAFLDNARANIDRVAPPSEGASPDDRLRKLIAASMIRLARDGVRTDRDYELATLYTTSMTVLQQEDFVVIDATPGNPDLSYGAIQAASVKEAAGKLAAMLRQGDEPAPPAVKH